MRSLVPLQSGLNASVPESTTGQTAIAAVILLSVLLLLVWAGRRRGYWGLRDDLGPVKSYVRAALDEQPAALLQLRSYKARQASAEELREAARPLFDPDADPSDSVGRVGRYTARGTVRRVLSATHHAWTTRRHVLPRAARVPLRWAVLVTVFGFLAMSTQRVLTALEADLAPDTPRAALDSAVTNLSALVDTVVATIGLFPYGGDVLGLTWSLTFVLFDLLFNAWYVVAAVLVLLAGVLWTLERQAPDVDVAPLVPSRLLGALVALFLVLLAWVNGVLVRVAGDALGYGGIGAGVGFATGVVWALVVPAALLAWVGRRRLASVRRQTNHVGAVVAQLTLTTLGGALSRVALVLVLGYAGILLVEGRLVEIAATVMGADVGVQAAVTFLVLGTLTVAAWLLRDAWPAVRQALGGLIAQRTVALVIGLTALPFVAVVPAYAIAYAFSRSVPIAVAVAIVVGLVVRYVTSYGVRVADRVDLRELFRPPAPIWVTVRAWVLDPPGRDADRQFYATVNGHAVCHTDREAALEAVVDAIQAKADPDPIKPSTPRQQTPEPSVASWHATYLERYGTHDVAETREKIGEQVRKHTLTLLRKKGPRVDRRQLDWQVEKYPESLCRERWDEMAPFIDVGERVATLRDDIWSDQVESRYATSRRDFSPGD